MKNPTIKAVLETIKELGRIAFFGALAALAGYLTNKLKGAHVDSIYYVAMTIALRLIDKFIHTNEATKLNGLTPF